MNTNKRKKNKWSYKTQINGDDMSWCRGKRADWKLHKNVLVTIASDTVKTEISHVRENHRVLASEGWWEAWQPSPLQGNQELLMARDKVGRPPGELGVSNSMECDIFPSVLWHCWLGDRKGIRPVKNLCVGLSVVMIWLELCTTYSSSCHHHLHHPLLQ